MMESREWTVHNVEHFRNTISISKWYMNFSYLGEQ